MGGGRHPLCTVRPVWSLRNPPPTWCEGLRIVAGERERTQVQMGRETFLLGSLQHGQKEDCGLYGRA